MFPTLFPDHFPAGRSLLGVLLVAGTQHEQVAGPPLDVEHSDDVAEVGVRVPQTPPARFLRYRRTVSSVLLDS